MKRLLTTLLVITASIVACKKDKPKTIPIVSTANLTNITTTSATAGGTITSNGNDAITASGIVWSKTNNNPTLTDSVVSGTTASGSFTVNLTNLEFGTTYYLRAYATNSIGTGYGNAVTLNTTNDTTKVRFSYNGQTVTYGIIISSVTGKKWLDRNLGATRVANSVNDVEAYGDYFQWGRLVDGHQKITSDTTRVLSSSDVPGHNKFIFPPDIGPFDWRNPKNPNLWQGANGINNPCPTGWHVPTNSDWANETGMTNLATIYSLLKLTAAGYRYKIGAEGPGAYAVYWSSTPDIPGTGSYYFLATSSSVSYPPSGGVFDRYSGMSIRCIKD